MTGKKPGRVTGITVYQKKGRTSWSYRLELERHPLTDERQFEYGHGFATDDDALTAAVKAKSDHQQGRRVKPGKMTVEEFFDEWLDSLRDSIKPSTLTNYTDYRDAYVVPIIGKKRLQKIDVPTLNALYRHLLTEGRRKVDNNSRMYAFWKSEMAAGRMPKPEEIADKCGVTIHAARKAGTRFRAGREPVAKSPGLAPKTVKNVHRMLHLAFSHAVAWRYLEYNPAEHASLPRESRKGKRQRGTTWTAEELAAWLKVAITDRDAGIWVLAATTGMRRSELAGIEREFVDLDAGTLEIGDTRVVVDGRADESDGKTASGRRVISLDPLTVFWLRRHMKVLEDEQDGFGDDYQDAGLLVCHPDGRPVHPDTITARFNRLVDRAGVRRIRLHDVRHTYATMALDAGIDPKIVSDRIGHANMAYTLAIYTHPSTGKDRDAAGKVAGLFGWACAKCGAAYFGEPPENGLCGPCAADDDGTEGAAVPA